MVLGRVSLDPTFFPSPQFQSINIVLFLVEIVRSIREFPARVAFGFFFVVQVRDFNFASVTFDHELKKFFVVRNFAGLS